MTSDGPAIPQVARRCRRPLGRGCIFRGGGAAGERRRQTQRQTRGPRVAKNALRLLGGRRNSRSPRFAASAPQSTPPGSRSSILPLHARLSRCTRRNCAQRLQLGAHLEAVAAARATKLAPRLQKRRPRAERGWRSSTRTLPWLPSGPLRTHATSCSAKRSSNLRIPQCTPSPLT